MRSYGCYILCSSNLRRECKVHKRSSGHVHAKQEQPGFAINIISFDSMHSYILTKEAP